MQCTQCHVELTVRVNWNENFSKSYCMHLFVAFQFGWTHVTLLIVVTQSHLIMQTLFEGLIW